MEISGPELVRRYKANYGIPDRALITEEMVLHHWALERRLTTELLSSEPACRWQVFERCYSRLYAELPWLNELSRAASTEAAADEAEDWSELIGPPPRRVYEIGSGTGRLAAALADRGYECTATEITRERGHQGTSGRHSLRWTVTDGVHLDNFERREWYDAAISDQVIEHLHPDDLAPHFAGACAILKAGGRYVCATPHAFAGPADVSRVFGRDRPEGMHLKEYTYRELRDAVYAAGFKRIEAVFRVPRAVRARCGRAVRPTASRAYFLYLRAVERAIVPLPHHQRRLAARVLRLGLWPSGMTLVATKA